MSTASRLITYEDSLLLPEDRLTEVINGELRPMPPPGLGHARLLERLAWLLRRGLDADRGLDTERFEVLVSTFGQMIRKEPFTYRVPDLGVYLRERLIEEHYISAIPELLAEVISSANRKGNLAELIEDYEHLQLPELWLVHPDARKIERRLLRNGKLEPVEVFSEGRISLQGAHGASVPVADLWHP